MFKSNRILSAIVFLVLAFTSNAQEVVSIEKRFDELLRSIQAPDSNANPGTDRVERVSAMYHNQISAEQSPESWKKKTGLELQLLYRSAHVAAEVTRDYDHIKDMTGVLIEMEARGQVVRSIFYTELFKVLVLSRHLKEASQLQADHPEVNFSKLPDFLISPTLNQETPTAWSVNIKTNEYYRHNVLLAGSQIIIVSHPSCHFTWNALVAIESDPILSRVFFSHATTWLLPQSGNIDLEAMDRLNTRFPGIKAKIAFDQKEWRQLDTWATPTFYFLNNGAVVSKVVGWPEGGNRNKIVAGFQKIGL